MGRKVTVDNQGPRHIFPDKSSVGRSMGKEEVWKQEEDAQRASLFGVGRAYSTQVANLPAIDLMGRRDARAEMPSILQ